MASIERDAVDVSLELKKAWIDKRSSIYLSKNWKEIKEYLFERGMEMSKEEIKKFLALQKTSDLQYKNYGKYEIASLGKPFVQRAKFFANMHCDSMILSKKQKYRTKKSVILVLIDQLSRFIMLEPCLSTNWVSQEKAWENVFKKLENMGYPNAISVIYHDSGVEYENGGFKALMKRKGIKNNVIRRRPYRLSKGSPYAESAIRRVRMNLERIMRMRSGDNFDDVLARTEMRCNKEQLSSLKMSAEDALTHDANYILLVSESLRWRRNKRLRKHVANQREIKQKTVVRIRRFMDKEFHSVSKESYGHLSKVFVVKSIDKSRAIWTYRVADLFTLKCIDGSYSMAELQTLDISYVDACHKESLNVKKIIGVENGSVNYEVEYSDITFCANESLVLDQN